MISRAWAQDDRLSYRARGVLLALMAWPAGDEHDAGSLAADSPDVTADVQAAIHELEAAGYLIVQPDGVDHMLVDPWPAPAITAVPCPGPTPYGVVYYLRRQDGAIKIGFTKQMARRLKKLDLEHGRLDLLATEPGGWHLEQERHAAFAALRIAPHREWFRPGPVLLAHVEALAAVSSAA